MTSQNRYKRKDDIAGSYKLTFHEAMESFSFLLHYILRYKKVLFLSLFSVVFVVFFVVLMGKEARTLIDQNFFILDTQARLMSILRLLGIICLLALGSFGRSYFTAWLSERVATDIRKTIFQKTIHLDISFFENIRPGEIVSTVMHYVSFIQMALKNFLFIGFRNILLLISSLIMMISISLNLSLYTLSVIPFILFPIVMFGRRMKKFSKKAQTNLAITTGYLDETLNHIHTMQTFTHEEIDKNTFNNYAERSFESAISKTYTKSLLSVLVMVSVSFGVVFMLWSGAGAIIQHHLTSGALTAFIIYACVAASSTSSFSEIIADFHRAAASAERLEELLKAKPTFNGYQNKKYFTKPVRGIVGFHNVSFFYPNNPENKVVDQVTFSVSPGENLALVGPSGAGKSTLSNLLLRFYDPQSGSIYFDGVNIRDLNIHELRKHIATVEQDPALFSTTIYNNILYGNPNATKQEIMKAIHLSGVENFLDDLPDGINYSIGTNGVKLSSGQRQRVAIARAIVRNSVVFLLDEATNALDSENEMIIQSALKNITSNRTTIVIAHRLATVLRCDRIVVIDHGKVQAIGTHAELIGCNSLYRRLVTLQFPDGMALSSKGSCYQQNYR